MACQTCTATIFESNKTWGKFHVYDILKSSPADCMLCARLRQDLTEHIYLLDDTTVTHRWTLRQSTRTRENISFIAITLRPTDDNPSLDVNLPTRIFYLIPEKDLEETPSAEALSDHTESKASLNQITDWVRRCEDEKIHPRCARQRQQRASEDESTTERGTGADSYTGFIPTRVIDVGENPYGHIRVIDTSIDQVRGKYMTLSYCWGPKPWYRMLAENREQLMDSIDWDDEAFPQTFKDAIKIAWQLKVRYLWIDALCICQDNDEFLYEGQRMHQVYRNSALNLAAAASKDSYGGFFRSRSPTVLAPKAIQVIESRILGKNSWRIFPEDIWQQQLLQQTLYTRGWVFQERMLSPRLIHFASDQLFWDCASLSACESLPAGLPSALDFRAATDRHWRERLQSATLSNDIETKIGTADISIDQLWKTAVHNYTSCSLTVAEKDKLFAIWGVAKLVRDLLGEEYADGMWQRNLHEQLVWRVKNYAGAKRLATVSEKPIPSWSWASITASDKFDATEILLADRLIPASIRHKVVKNHYGESIGFTSLIPTETIVVDNAARITQPHELQPELANINLAIQGHVFQVLLVGELGDWTLDVDGVTQSHKKFELFPDLLPYEHQPDHEAKTAQRFSLRSGLQEGPFVQEDFAIVTASSRLVDAETFGGEGIPEYQGVGLTLERARSKEGPTFRRTGMFRFEGLTEDEWRSIDRTDAGLVLQFEADENGLKFWLQ